MKLMPAKAQTTGNGAAQKSMRDPIARFLAEYAMAQKLELNDHTAVVLATSDATTGRPSARVVLLKQVDAKGFVFFTNYESRKGVELAQNPWAALCFHWPVMKAQVRVEGYVDKLSEQESDAYFAKRPRLSRIAAWSS